MEKIRYFVYQLSWKILIAVPAIGWFMHACGIPHPESIHLLP